jgi:peptidoglycan/xylan/chitin deacetylase (PgdA/CDA1 family)
MSNKLVFVSRVWLLGFILSIFFVACAPTTIATPTLTPTKIPTLTATSTPIPTNVPTPTATFTPDLAISEVEEPDSGFAEEPTQVFIRQGPGMITCPILLYHRIETPDFPNEYYVSPENFRAQMQALKDWGYTPIPISLLVKAIREGALLPERPVIITFDDGDITVYTAAFPIMQEFGFVGVNYLVSNRLNADGFLNFDHIQEMAKAGWEVGSHSMTHADLTETTNPLDEIVTSRAQIEQILGLSAETFAYPYGLKTDATLNTVRKHYIAAVGLGSPNNQDASNLYYLWRRPVKYEWDLETFGRYLPWNTTP